MYRFLFRPKWVAFHVLCILGVVLMVNFSLWQFHRLDERQAFNRRVLERSTYEIVDVAVLDMNDPVSLEWRSAGAIGTYLADEQVLILNRSQSGTAGMNVVTPLLLEDGRAVLVNRGFIPLNAAPPAAPTGTVQVVGQLRASESRSTGQATEASGDLEEFFRLDISRLQEQIDQSLLPVALVAKASKPADDPLLAPVAPPELSEGPHLSYAIQWLIFAVAVIVGWVLAVRKSLTNRVRSAPSA